MIGKRGWKGLLAGIGVLEVHLVSLGRACVCVDRFCEVILWDHVGFISKCQSISCRHVMLLLFLRAIASAGMTIMPAQHEPPAVSMGQRTKSSRSRIISRSTRHKYSHRLIEPEYASFEPCGPGSTYLRRDMRRAVPCFRAPPLG